MLYFSSNAEEEKEPGTHSLHMRKMTLHVLQGAGY